MKRSKKGISKWILCGISVVISLSILSACGRSQQDSSTATNNANGLVAAETRAGESKTDAQRDNWTDTYASGENENVVGGRSDTEEKKEYQDSQNGSNQPTTNFKDYGVNTFNDVEKQSVSTFSLDIDTASYTIARKYLNEGLVPPKDAIRVEEFVNYFKRDYPKPAQDTFSMYTEIAPSAFNRGYHILEVGIQGKDISATEMKRTALTFVIDVSGSMDMENRLGLVKKSLKILVDQMSEKDKIGIVVYGTNGRKLLEPTNGSNKDDIMKAINKLEPEGSTNAEEGLMIGYDMANEAFIKGGNNRVILCTDGVANQGITNAEDILEMVEDYKARGVNLTTLGFGMDNYDDIFLETLADKGDGNYAYIDTLEEARKVFIDQLAGTLQVIAKDTKAQVEFNSDCVESYRLIGYDNRALANEDFKNNSVDAGEIGAGHSVTALYEVKLKNNIKGELGVVKLRYKDPQSNKVTELSKSIKATDISSSFYSATPRFRFITMVAQTAEILRGSPWASNTKLKDVYDILKNDIKNLDMNEEDSGFINFIRQAIELKGE